VRWRIKGTCGGEREWQMKLNLYMLSDCNGVCVEISFVGQNIAEK
jgi:hypothetical protein